MLPINEFSCRAPPCFLCLTLSQLREEGLRHAFTRALSMGDKPTMLM